MAFLRTKNSTLSQIVTVAERLDDSAQKELLANIKKYELALMARRLDNSVKNGKKPSVKEIAEVVRKVRKANAKKKTR